jgi:hypothetical protein
MKNITFSAEEDLIARAREKARARKTTLNKEFRIWLKQYAERGRVSDEIDIVMESLDYAYSGKKFTREELNER